VTVTATVMELPGAAKLSVRRSAGESRRDAEAESSDGEKGDADRHLARVADRVR